MQVSTTHPLTQETLKQKTVNKECLGILGRQESGAVAL